MDQTLPPQTIPAAKNSLSADRKSHRAEPLTPKANKSSYKGLSLHQLVEQQAEKTPEAIAIVHAGQNISYQALNQSANQLARYLVEQGTKAERLVGISLTRSPSTIVAFLAVLKAGAAYVPIDPNYPEARRQYILADANVEILLTQTDLLDQLAAEQKQVNRVLCLDSMTAELANYADSNLSIAIDPKQLAYVIYTSGSTGNPKGVMAHHLGLVNYSLAIAEALDLSAADRMLQFSTMSFDFIISEIYPTLAVGGAVVLRSDDTIASTRAFVDFIAETEVSVIQFTTAFWHELVSGIDRLGIKLPASLRIVLFGGEKASLALCRQWLKKVGSYPRMFNAYGPTESTVITTVYDAIAEGYDGSEDLPIGRAIRNALTYVLDENKRPVAAGEPGELYIGGPGVTRGYLNLPEKTQAVFVDSPFEPGTRLYKTGDLVRMDESGLISFVGRADFQVKIRGFRIELGEIESCLDRFGTIAQRVVIAREDTPGDKRLVAYVVTKPGIALDRTALNQFFTAELPGFMVPSAVVELPEMPKNPNGKIDRKALPIPTIETNSKDRTLTPPRTPLEKQLVAMWRSVLDTEEIGITENFFEIGGHSLLVMRLFSELEATFNRQLPLIEIFAAPTIEQMAKRLEEVLASPSEHSSSPVKNADNHYLTTLKAGTQHPPLFMMHDVVGDTGLYIHLARRLGEHKDAVRSIYAIKPKRVGQTKMVHTRIPDIARHCVEQIRRIQPQGPYLLGGLCAGGVIAFEVALQLEAIGEPVALTLLDAPSPTAKRRTDLVTNQRKQGLSQILAASNLQTAIKQLWEKGRNTLCYEVKSRTESVQTTLQNRAFRWYQDRELALPKLLQNLTVHNLFMFAYRDYLPNRRLKNKVLLIRATEGNGTKADTPYVTEYEHPLLGWNDWAESLETCDVPGGHSTMLSEQHVRSLANAMDSFIENRLEEINKKR